ncbi:hypothetical protein [Sphingomonas abaci]|uniref:Uncharacterized protein n=1 Tax=Sphingomonas abaci TaxID=237611 RepID=A0A7W7EXQ3_9SPHN|nr:hypothetical protein [Sphingomonas abaci]MBB4617326.1 hypothetical protein [Sphingomonas abaci]
MVASAANILICTLPLDYTAFAVAAGIELLGGRVEILMPSLMPHFQTHTFVHDDSWSFALDGRTIFSEDQRFTSIWLRRTGGSSLNLSRPEESSKVYLSTIHSSYGRSLTSLISRFAGEEDAVIVNEFSSKATANSKLDQLVLAQPMRGG